MHSEGDVVDGYGRCMVIVADSILVTDERRPVQRAGVYEVRSKTYDVLSQCSRPRSQGLVDVGRRTEKVEKGKVYSCSMRGFPLEVQDRLRVEGQRPRNCVDPAE